MRKGVRKGVRFILQFYIKDRLVEGVDRRIGYELNHEPKEDQRKLTK